MEKKKRKEKKNREKGKARKSEVPVILVLLRSRTFRVRGNRESPASVTSVKDKFNEVIEGGNLGRLASLHRVKLTDKVRKFGAL